MDTLTRFKAAIFDLDGVITHTAAYHYKAWKKLADELGVAFDQTENEKLKGIDRMASLNHILKLGSVVCSETEKHAMADRKNSYYQEMIRELSTRDILPGVLELLDYLEAHQVRIGLASASKNAPTILDSLKLTDRFDYIANPALARSKPAPDIFLFSAYGLEVHPEVCVGFEDSVAGLKAIKDASMYAVSVGAEELARYSDVHVTSLEQCLR